MCGATGAIVDLCDQEHHEISSITSSSSSSVEKVWKETQQLMEQSEHLVRIMTHVCSQQLSGVFRTVVKYSQGCWRRCSVDGAEGERQGPHQQLHSTCCEGPCRSQYPAGEQQQEETCRWRGPGPRWRRRGRCQSGQCEHCKNMDSGGSAGLPPAPATHHLCCPPPTPPSSTSSAPTLSPKWRTGTPSHPSILTILLLLVVTLARFTEGCSSRSTPKPRPPSPTMRPNITFQTYACPPAYAAWYCLNGATCFTVKIGESILYNCECADGYMGQRCEFKDLDGSYLPTREKVLLETASIAGGATVACVLVFVVLFAVYVFMQKDKDKRCRDLDDGRNNDRQPFSGYQNPRPEIIRTISNPYARTIEELSHVEVQPTKAVPSPESSKDTNTSSNVRASTTSTTNINITNTTDTNSTDTNVHSAQDPS